jgi:hypothetical protein
MHLDNGDLRERSIKYVKKLFSSWMLLGFLSGEVLDGGEWLASCPGHFTSRGRTPQCPLYRRLGGPRASLDAVEKRKISFSSRESIPDFSTVHPIVHCCTV